MVYDVIIAGAGPAGSTCARTCAKQGLKTLLLDRDEFPRSKPCAGAVSEQALKHLDFPLPEQIIEDECFSVRIHFKQRTVQLRRECRFAVLVTRKYFDEVLVNKALEDGVKFLAGEQVVKAQQGQDAVEVITRTQTYRGKYLVGADGVHSRVAQALRPSPRKDEIALALVSHIPADDQEIQRRLDKTLDLYFGEAPIGYGWLFPHRGYYSAGIAGLASRFSSPRERMADLSHSLKVNLTSVEGHFIPLGGMKRSIAAGRILLAGDAAGFADPIHGEGISHAILSGKLAAQAIIGAIIGGKAPSSAVSRYRRDTERLINKQLRIALRMANQLEKHPNLFMRIFVDHPKVLLRYLDIPAGKSDYCCFQRWVFARAPFLLLPPAITGSWQQTGDVLD